MKYIFNAFLAVLFTIFLNGCSGGGGSGGGVSNGSNPNGYSGQDGTATPRVITTISATSSSFGNSGDTLILSGDNLPETIEDINVTLGGISTDVISVDEDALEIRLPQVEEPTVSTVGISSPNRNWLIDIENDRGGQVLIYPRTANQWISFSTDTPAGDSPVHEFHQVDGVSGYLAVQNNGGGGSIYRTLDGGSSWTVWAPMGFRAAFHPTSDHEGWASFITSVQRIAFEGTNKIEAENIILENEDDDNTNGNFADVYVSDDFLDGVAITIDRKVYITSDGENFSLADTTPTNKPELYRSHALDAHNIWAIGADNVQDLPLVFFCNGDNTSWQSVTISDPESPRVNRAIDVDFIDSNNGFIIAAGANDSPRQIFRTLNGGTDWEHQGESDIWRFTFVNDAIGWGIVNSDIYRTDDAGATWNLDFSITDDTFVDIDYSDGVVWAVARSSVARYSVNIE